MKKPSSTITWATLAGFGASGLWGVVDTFTEAEPSLGLVSASVAIASGVVGKLVPEKVLEAQFKAKHGIK